MAAPDIKQIFVIEGLEFTTITAAQRHLRVIQLHEFFRDTIPDDDVLDDVIEKILNNRWTILPILDDGKKVTY